MQQQDNHEYPFLYQRQTCHQVQPNQATYQKRQKCQPATYLMSNIQTGAERMPHDLSHLGFLAGQIGRLITISTTPVIAGDSFEMDAVGALRLSPLRRGLAIDSTVDIFTFYVPHRHVYGEQWIKFMKD